MDTTSPRFVILAAIDGSPATENVVASAARFTQMIAGGELHLLHVVDRVADAETTIAGEAAADLQAERRKMIEDAARRARELGVLRVLIHVVDATTVAGVLSTAMPGL